MLPKVLEAEIFYNKIILVAQSESCVHFIPGSTVKIDHAFMLLQSDFPQILVFASLGAYSRNLDKKTWGHRRHSGESRR